MSLFQSCQSQPDTVTSPLPPIPRASHEYKPHVVRYLCERVCMGLKCHLIVRRVSSFRSVCHQHLWESESITWRTSYSPRCIRIVKRGPSRCRATAEMTNPVSLPINHSYLALIDADSTITDEQIAAFAPWLKSHSCLTPTPQSVMTRFQFAKKCG